VIKSHVLYH